MTFELNNDQRIYFGLDPVRLEWDRVILKGDTYRPDSILYFEGEVIKRHIVSTEYRYEENHYNDLTRQRSILLPVTSKGKERKLTASVLESRQPQGVYCVLDTYGRILIGNYNTQTAFYDSFWENNSKSESAPISIHVEKFVYTSPPKYLSDIEAFKHSKRKNIKFKHGDFFAFKINRSEYGFGRVLLNIDKLRKTDIISKEHGLSLIMGKPVLIKVYAYTSKSKNSIEQLTHASSLPSDYIMDNKLFYGEYEIIGNKPLHADEIDFPKSYGRHIDGRRNSVFFQWGLIHVELPFSAFNKYLSAKNPFVPESSPSSMVSNPYGYYSIGFSPNYNGQDIKNAISNNGTFDYQNNATFKGSFDLRNPQNQSILEEVMATFGLHAKKGYYENCLQTKTITTVDLLKL